MPSNSRRWMLAGLTGLILIGAVLILSSIFAQPAAGPTLSTIAPQRLDQGPAPEVPRVSLGDAHAAYEAKQAVFVDARSQGQYEASHVVGALSIPLDELESRLSELNQAQWIITYCT